MNQDKKYQGVVIPAVTPLTENHELDQSAVEKMFTSLRQQQAMPFILGTTGEGASLSVSVKQAYIKLAGILKKNEDILYTGVSSNCLQESIELAKYAFDHGTDVVVSTVPSYYPLTNDQMLRYFEDLVNAIRAPLIIYNIPATTHVSLSLEMIDLLSRHPNIVAIKDSERSEERLMKSLALWKDRKDFSHFIGWAAKSADALINGSDGLIPSTGNFHPAIYYRLSMAVRAGDHEKAYYYQKLSDQLGDLYQVGKTLGQSLWALKVLMKQRGICQPYMMPPLQMGKAQEEKQLIGDFINIIEKEQLEFV